MTDRSVNMKGMPVSPKIIDKKEKKRHILKAAIRVFAKSGLAQAKIRQIAEAAGIGKGTIYEYFSSKEELFWMAFEVFAEETGQIIQRKIASVKDPAEKIRVYITSWAEMMNNEMQEFSNLMFEIWAESMRRDQKKGRTILAEMYAQYRLQIKSILDEGVSKNIFKPMNTMGVAGLIIGGLDGLFLQWLIDRDVFLLEESVHQFAHILVDGLMKTDSE